MNTTSESIPATDCPPDDQVDTGITRRHSRSCGLRGGKESCSCRPSFQAQAWSAPERKPVRKTFGTLKEAREWRQLAAVDLRRRQMNVPSELLLRDAAERWLAAARSGIIRTRSGQAYKPSALRTYEAALRSRLLPALGNQRLSAITRNRVQDLIDELTTEGLAPSTVHNAVLPLRAIYRYAEEREEISVNPMTRVNLPKDHRRRERIAEPREIELLLDVLPPHYRVLWSAAVFTGLRRGELQALAWTEVDLDAGVLRVEHSWDRVAGLIEPKSRAGKRSVPIPSALSAELRSHKLRQGVGGRGFVFSSSGDRPFDPSNALRRAHQLWKDASLNPLGFHEARHSYASLMIAAGVNAKALSTYMGHSSITVTLDRYGHLMPGNEREAAAMLDAFLDRDLEKRKLRAVK